MTSTSTVVTADRVFVDTGAWIAFLDAGDQHHKVISEFFRASTGESALVTTDAVIFETLTYLNCSLKSHRLAVDFYRSVTAAAGMDVIAPGSEVFEQALEEYFFKFDDKRFSVVDAVSFLVMKRLGLRRALTLDKHFQDVGFEMVIGVA